MLRQLPTCASCDESPGESTRDLRCRLDHPRGAPIAGGADRRRTPREGDPLDRLAVVPRTAASTTASLEAQSRKGREEILRLRGSRASALPTGHARGGRAELTSVLRVGRAGALPEGSELFVAASRGGVGQSGLSRCTNRRPGRARTASVEYGGGRSRGPLTSATAGSCCTAGGRREDCGPLLGFLQEGHAGRWP